MSHVFNYHENHTICQTIPSTLSTILKDDTKHRINSYMQNTLSILLACNQNYELNLKSKQTYNLKDKNSGKTCKRMSKMSDVSGAIANSAMLINHLDNDLDIACLAEHQQMTTAKK